MTNPDDHEQQSSQPDPLSAVLSVASYAVAEIRRLPAQAVRLPLLALNYGLAVADRLIREYDALREKAGSTGDEPAAEPPPDGEPSEPGRPVAGFVTPPADGATPAPATSAATTAATEPPKRAPTKAPRPADSAASPDVQKKVERVTARQDVSGPLERDDLPLPDFDHMTLGSLRGRLRNLDSASLVVLRDYERAHADRLPVVTMLDNRIAKLAAQQA